jgi:antitoxin YqcF
MRDPTESERLLGRHIRATFGGTTRVVGYGDDDGRQDVFLVSAEDIPTRGVTSYGTVGLFNTPQPFQDKRVFVEILGACASATRPFANLIGSCVFESRKNGTPVVHGGVMPGILDQYEMSNTLRHVTFVSPFLWDGFKPFPLEEKEIHWLLALPISDGERGFLGANGIDALEALFEERQIDLFDINRLSAV